MLKSKGVDMFDYLINLFFPKQPKVVDNIQDTHQDKRLPLSTNVVVPPLPKIAPNDQINHLPLDLQLYIFSFLNSHAKAAMCATCRTSRNSIDKARILYIEQQAKNLQEKIQRQILDGPDAYNNFIALVEACERYILKSRDYSLKLRKFLILSTDDLRLSYYTIARSIIINFCNAMTRLINDESIKKSLKDNISGACTAVNSILETQEPALRRVWRPIIF